MLREKNQRRFSLLGSVTAVSLILTGLITYLRPGWTQAGLFFIYLGVISLILYIIQYLGFFRHPLFQKINSLLQDREDAPLDPVSKIGILIYLTALAYIYIIHNLRVTHDQIIFLGIFIAALMGKTRKFLSDWLPLVILVFAYESMRGIADNIGFPINYTPLIEAEKTVFLGTLPTITLQEIFYTPGVTHWYDILAVNIYFLHFTPALIFAIYLWAKKDALFHEYRDSMILLCYMALVTFMLIPAAPPWLAYEEGYITEKLYRVQMEIDRTYSPEIISVMYLIVTSNDVAAIPSLHAAYPILLFIYAFKYWRKKATPLITFPIAMGLSAVYLGEHYMIDIFLGFVYASIAYYIIENKIIQTRIRKHTT